ncbi:DegV family protein with EDD domain [Ruminococcaceae bacterium R-25]|nr:DegV family protein with EDD domain [Ruminococcaceae bacterium R-25]SUQ11376.1 EDD domain protein, DegV family [Oscillospiraceae bacterium]
MADYVILTDSSTDLTKDLRKRFGIDDYLPGNITFPDGHTEDSTLDWENISPQDFYTSMSKDSMYTTGIKNIEVQEAFFEKYLKQGLDILSISLSHSLSNTFDSCRKAAQNLLEKYPERKIICVDSLRYSGGDGLLCSYAGEMKQEGKSLEEVAEWLENNKHRCHQTGTVDDLKFLAKMGRCSNVSAFMGSLINIKPIAEFNRDGMNQIITKVTGYKKLFSAVIEYMKATIDPEPKRIFVSHTFRKAQWLQLQELIRENFPTAEIIPTTVNMANGSSIGPGMVVAFYMGKEISEGLAEETKILEEIKAKL